MARWAMRGYSQAHVLEPSAGEGVFLQALREVASESGCALTMTGVECSPETLRHVIEQGLLEPARAICSDFLAVTPFPVQAVIGNPPYVRLRNAPADEAERALQRAEEALGEKMDPSGSVWMPLILHASRFLTPGGRLAYVLPYDITYRRYARVLWDFLGKRFGSLRVVRVGERIFPDILQEAVLLYADDYGASTDTIRYEVFDTRAQFLEDKPTLHEDMPLADIVAGERRFTEALLGDELRELLRDVVEPATVPIADLATIRIGYVAGDKSFFHPSKEAIAEYGIASTSLRPALTSGRRLARKGIWTSRCQPDHLFLPGAEGLSAGERRYVAHGEALGVSSGYKCRNREPWFVVPDVRTPDLVFPAFTQRPLVLINDAGLAASNSLLCAYMRPERSRESFVVSWYTSLTALQLELNVHALGGGVLALAPVEVSRMRLVPGASSSSGALDELNALVSAGAVSEALRLGDEKVLAPALRLTPYDIDLIETGRANLARWRTTASAKDDGPPSLTGVPQPAPP
jgi:adenine-specific DNA-methyltransferase